MPTYEYRCPNGHEFELFQRMSDEPVAECPTCGEGSERLLSSGAGLIFKGEGFYITDYRSDSYKKAESADSGSNESKDAGNGDSATTPASDSKGSDSAPSTSSSDTASSDD